MALMQKAVQDGGGDGVAEHGAPLAGSEVAGDEDDASLAARATELEHEESGFSGAWAALY
jgi:hypothetical protein